MKGKSFIFIIVSTSLNLSCNDHLSLDLEKNQEVKALLQESHHDDPVDFAGDWSLYGFTCQIYSGITLHGKTVNQALKSGELNVHYSFNKDWAVSSQMVAKSASCSLIESFEIKSLAPNIIQFVEQKSQSECDPNLLMRGHYQLSQPIKYDLLEGGDLLVFNSFDEGEPSVCTNRRVMWYLVRPKSS